MFFNEMLELIKSQIPQPAFYELDILPDTAVISLSENDIKMLVDFSVEYKAQVLLRPANKMVALSTLLLSMGTRSPSLEKDVFLGQKDERIEKYIIDKAKKRANQTGEGVSSAVAFGLSGNPPTMNHLISIQHLMTHYETVHVILNAQSPLKDPLNYLPAETRFEMLQAMLEAEHVDLEKCKIERLEIDRDPPSRMIGTMSLLMLNSDPGTKLTLMLGLDGLYEFNKWYKYAEYGDLCDLKFYPRKGMAIDVNSTIEALSTILDKNIHVVLVYASSEQKNLYEVIRDTLGNRINLCEENIPTFEGSSTDLRTHYASASDDMPIPENIHPIVDDLIREKALYGYVQHSSNKPSY